MRLLRLLGIFALFWLLVGATMVNQDSAIYAGHDVGVRPLLALLMPAAFWLVALVFALTATVLSLREGQELDILTLLLARGPAVLLFFAFAVRLFLFAARE